MGKTTMVLYKLSLDNDTKRIHTDMLLLLNFKLCCYLKLASYPYANQKKQKHTFAAES